MLKLNRNQLRWVVGLLTGHCHLNGHLFKLGLSNSPNCDRCQKENETATHPVWMWGPSLFKISPPGSIFHGTKWLFRRPQVQNPALRSKCGIAEGITKERGKVWKLVTPRNLVQVLQCFGGTCCLHLQGRTGKDDRRRMFFRKVWKLVTSHNLLQVLQCFGGTCCLHLQGRRDKDSRRKRFFRKVWKL
jgi:hypothetical protein